MGGDVIATVPMRVTMSGIDSDAPAQDATPAKVPDR